MNKKAAILVISLLFLIASFMIYHIIRAGNLKNKQISNLPNHTLKRIDGTDYRLGEYGNSTFLIFYNSSCYYCIDQVQQLIENISFFSCMQILLVSSEDLNVIKDFSGNFKCDQVEFLYDNKSQLYNSLKIKVTPTILFYSEKNKLIKMFSGITSIEEVITEVLNEE